MMSARSRTEPTRAAAPRQNRAALQAMLVVLAVTAAEVAVGLALVILLYRSHKDTRIDLANEMKQ